MVKVTRNKTQIFVPITIILETQDELDFMLGLLDATSDTKKYDCIDFDYSIDEHIWNKLKVFN